MAVGWFRRFVGFVRIWTKIGLFCGPKAKWNTWNTRNTWNTWNTVCGCSDCFFVNISKNSVAKLRMADAVGKTNRECCYFWDGGVVGIVVWKWTKSRGAGMWGLKPFRGTASGIKPENSFSALSPLSPTVARGARHSHPSPPEKKAASRKKSRLRRKKTAPIANSGASCVSRVVYSYLWILATTDPPRLIALTSLPPTFIHFHPSNPTTPPRKKQHPLLVLPSVHTIINFATKFFDILTKKQFEHPQRVFQVFQVFRVFQVFHFAFGPQNSPVLVQIRTKQVFQVFQAGSP